MISKDNPWRVGIRYEVALETLDAITAHYAGVKGLEREKPNPDEAVMRMLAGFRMRCSRFDTA